MPLDQVRTASPAKPLPLRSVVVDEDYPCSDDVDAELLSAFDEWEDQLANVNGFKLGGWPSLIQSEIYWAPHNRHPAQPEFVCQIDTTDKGNWMWGDAGVAYFGRGTARGHLYEWTFEWQCF